MYLLCSVMLLVLAVFCADIRVGGVMKSWSKRWFILYEDGRLVFYKSPADWSNQGVTIDLAVCATVQDRVAFGAKGLSVDWPTGVLRECCFVIATQTRPVYLYGTNKDEARYVCAAFAVTFLI